MEGKRAASMDHESVGCAATREEGEGGEGEESLGIKLRKGISVGKKGGSFTPVPSWKMEAGPSSSMANANKSKPSARKLGASLWEVQDFLPFPNMGKSKMRHHQLNLSDASEPNSPIWPQRAARSSRRGTSFDQHHKLTGRTTGDLKLESPRSHNSSMEISALNHAITPSSSLDLKGRLKDSGYNVKTSAELLKVLNRIWSLEEELTSNVSLIKTLKAELHHARSCIEELMQEKHTYRVEMDNLMKRVSEDRATRKNKERDRIKEAVQSIKNELEDEKKLGQRSESLHRKLGKELSEVNSAFKETLNNLENETKARCLLEDLCDEFAQGFQENEQEIRNLKQKFGKDSDHTFDQSLHHISKIWTNERLQMKIAEAHGDKAEKNKIQEKITVEIKRYFQAKRFYSSRNNGACQKDEKGCSLTLRRHSVESVHLNGAASAPQDAEDGDSVVSDFHCFELNTETKDNLSKSGLKQSDEEEMKRLKGKSGATFKNDKWKHPEKVEGSDITEGCNRNKMHHIDRLRGNSSRNGIEEYKVQLDSNNQTDSCNRVSVSCHATPMDEINASSDLDISKCSSKLQETVKENSLKKKLLEARSEGKNARLRALRDSCVGGAQ